MNKGPLVRVQIGPNRFAKMHEQDAIARGLIEKPKAKAKKQRRPAADKRRRPAQNKAQSQPVDAFVTIRGIGKATAEKLREMGIFTFEQLKTADIGGLSGRSWRAIQDWREEQK